MSHTLRRAPLTLAGAMGLVLAAAGPALGQAGYTWIAPSGLFSDPGNWNPPGVPMPIDHVLFGDAAFGDQFVVDFDGDFQNNRAKVHQGAVLWNLNGHIYDLWLDGDPSDVSLAIGCEVGITANAQLALVGGNVTPRDGYIGWLPENAGELIVGQTGRYSAFMHNLVTGLEGAGRLTVCDGGVVEHGHGSAAVGTLSTACITVTGPGSLYWVTGYYALADRGRATMLVEDGGTARMGVCMMGDQVSGGAGSFGAATIDGPGSLWDQTAAEDEGLVIGRRGGGAVLVQSGGRLRCAGGLYLGQMGGGSGTLTVSGAGSVAEVASHVNVGREGAATLRVEAGGTLAHGGDVRVGDWVGGRGIVTVTGPGSRLLATADGWIELGPEGQGTLVVADGASVSCSSAILGRYAGGCGEAVVDGAGSLWDIWHALGVGGVHGPPAGAGTLTVRGGGRVTIGNEGVLEVHSQGTVELERGRIDARAASVWEGACVRIENGTLAATDGVASEGEIQMASDLARLDTPTLTNAGNLFGRGFVSGNLENGVGGWVRAAAGDRLAFGGDTHMNYGNILLQGGAVSFEGVLITAGGSRIMGCGTLAGEVNHQGQMLFSGGTADIFGNVYLMGGAGGGEVITSGTGSTTTFYDDVDHHGDEVRTASGCTTVFFGDVTGPGPFTGPGTVRFEGTYSPGASPGRVPFGGDVELASGSVLVIELAGLAAGQDYDHLDVAGCLAVGGTLRVDLVDGFAPAPGSRFDLLDFGSLIGAFDRLCLPDLGPALAWDTRALYADGSVGVTPEPATLALLAAGLALAAARRRRA